MAATIGKLSWDSEGVSLHGVLPWRVDIGWSEFGKLSPSRLFRGLWVLRRRGWRLGLWLVPEYMKGIEELWQELERREIPGVAA
jgi:hypothetical protein